MSKIWPIFGNIILFILVIGGASYILIQLVGREDDPEPQILEEVKIDAEEVVASEAVVDEVSSSDSVQEQTIATGPTRVVTATSSLSSTEPHLKLTSLTRVDRNLYPCNTPHFSPSGDKFLCYLRVKDELQLWLASLDEGLKRPLVMNQPIQFTWFDDHHILYAHSIEKPYSNIPEPAFLMNVNSTQKVHLGLTTRQTQLQGLVANQVAFLNQHEVHIVNFDLRTNLTAELQTTLSIAEQPLSTDRQTAKSDEIDPLTMYYFRKAVKVSPDAQKVVILQTAYEKGTLTILDRQSKHETILAENIAAPSEGAFSWSPDSTKLVYTLIPTDTYLPELWMVNTADLEAPQLLLTGPGRHTFDFVTWLPDKEDVLFVYIPSGVNPINESVYQVINVQTGEHRELFTNGSNLKLSLTNDGYRIIFRREFVDGKLDISTWIATLSY